MEAACALSLECWRLGRLVEEAPNGDISTALKRSVRIIADVLRGLDMQTIDFAARRYDSGMAPEVVEVQEDELEGAASESMVQETIAPTLTWGGHVVSPGQIVVRRPAISIAPTGQASE
jgi:hypothetical protein